MDSSSTPGASLDQRLIGAIPELRSLVRRLGGRVEGAADVEDLVQEVLTRALRSRHTFDEQRELGPWLRRTALRAHIEHLLARLEPVERDALLQFRRDGRSIREPGKQVIADPVIDEAPDGVTIDVTSVLLEEHARRSDRRRQAESGGAPDFDAQDPSRDSGQPRGRGRAPRDDHGQPLRDAPTADRGYRLRARTRFARRDCRTGAVAPAGGLAPPTRS